MWFFFFVCFVCFCLKITIFLGVNGARFCQFFIETRWSMFFCCCQTPFFGCKWCKHFYQFFFKNCCPSRAFLEKWERSPKNALLCTRNDSKTLKNSGNDAKRRNDFRKLKESVANSNFVFFVNEHSDIQACQLSRQVKKIKKEHINEAGRSNRLIKRFWKNSGSWWKFFATVASSLESVQLTFKRCKMLKVAYIQSF